MQAATWTPAAWLPVITGPQSQPSPLTLLHPGASHHWLTISQQNLSFVVEATPDRTSRFKQKCTAQWGHVHSTVLHHRGSPPVPPLHLPNSACTPTWLTAVRVSNPGPSNSRLVHVCVPKILREERR